MKKLVRENPALFLEEERADLERIHAVDTENGKKLLIKNTNEENASWCSEMLVCFPNDIEVEISDEYAD